MQLRINYGKDCRHSCHEAKLIVRHKYHRIEICGIKTHLNCSTRPCKDASKSEIEKKTKHVSALKQNLLSSKEYEKYFIKFISKGWGDVLKIFCSLNKCVSKDCQPEDDEEAFWQYIHLTSVINTSPSFFFFFFRMV